jgi:organic hydroperoxide reductase OsmC/OhrA
MSEHKVTLKWERGGAEFSYQKYPRDHTWSFDGGHRMMATVAPAYLGNPANVDPEEAFVASLSSCHMLTFLASRSTRRQIMTGDRAAAVIDRLGCKELFLWRMPFHLKKGANRRRTKTIPDQRG